MEYSIHELENLMRIMIADHSLELCSRLTDYINLFEGITVAGLTHDVLETINSITRLKPEAVLLDFRMPGGSALDVLEAVKRMDSPPIMMVMTDDEATFFRHSCLSAGADYFFDKSADFKKMIDTITNLKEFQAHSIPN
jgi:DNA-binding NarL/FixJ family response regulator